MNKNVFGQIEILLILCHNMLQIRERCQPHFISFFNTFYNNNKSQFM